MDFKRYNLFLWLLLSLLVTCSFLMGWAFFTGRIHLAVVFLVMVLTEAIFLYGLLTRTQKKILFFFEAVENDDTSVHYSSRLRSRFTDELNGYLNQLNQNFREMRVSHDLREQYFNRILENLTSGLMVVSKNGHINHINQEALRLFNLTNLTHVKALAEVDRNLYNVVKGMQPGTKREVTLKDRVTGIRRILGLQCTEINLKGEDTLIITLQDLSVEMDRKEIDDWIRLIQVMSHEIMNSLAPITSISTTLKEIWSEKGDQSQMTHPAIQQTLKGLDAIAEQSQGLTTFFRSYRVLSRIPDPDMSEFPVCNLFDKLETLVTHNQENAGIRIVFECEESDMYLRADEQMIIQVMLNLIKNAVQALEETSNPEITVRAFRMDGENAILTVTDNGPGIPTDIAGEIFMPFFTTKVKGTGVGLSYSRQVLNLNGGVIEFESVAGKTEFRVIFPR